MHGGLDARLAHALGVAAAEQLGARVVLGRDARLSGPLFCNALVAGLRAAGADMGIAWDGDFDRCFFYDGDGNLIEGYYCIGLLAQELLR